MSPALAAPPAAFAPAPIAAMLMPPDATAMPALATVPATSPVLATAACPFIAAMDMERPAGRNSPTTLTSVQGNTEDRITPTAATRKLMGLSVPAAFINCEHRNTMTAMTGCIRITPVIHDPQRLHAPDRAFQPSSIATAGRNETPSISRNVRTATMISMTTLPSTITRSMNRIMPVPNAAVGAPESRLGRSIPSEPSTLEVSLSDNETARTTTVAVAAVNGQASTVLPAARIVSPTERENIDLTTPTAPTPTATNAMTPAMRLSVPPATAHWASPSPPAPSVQLTLFLQPSTAASVIQSTSEPIGSIGFHIAGLLYIPGASRNAPVLTTVCWVAQSMICGALAAMATTMIIVTSTPQPIEATILLPWSLPAPTIAAPMMSIATQMMITFAWMPPTIFTRVCVQGK